MYKDVKKKLLAVALSICMVICIVEIAPRVQAAAGATVLTVEATYGGQGDVETFTVELDATSFTYNGNPQSPKITRITGNTEGTQDVTLFSLGVPDSVEQGTYTATLQPSDSGWEFKQGSTITTEYEIKAAPISYIEARTTETPVVDYTGSVAVPDKSSVIVVINGNTTLNADQFEIVGAQSTVGTATAKVNVTDKNYEQGAVVSNDISYIIAYNLGNTNANRGPVGRLDNANLNYTPGTPIADPVATFAQGGNAPVLTVSRTNNPGNMFSIQYNRLTLDASGNVTNRTPVNGALANAGEYEMVVAPVSPITLVGSSYFTGTFAARFSVQRIGVGSLIVSANDAFNISHDLNGANAFRLKLPYSNRDSEGKVHPTNIVVRTGQAAGSPILPQSDYTITYLNDDQPGVATMIITPNADTDYTGSITISYDITSSLYMEKTVIIGENGGTIVAENREEPKIVYDGQCHTVDTINSEVYADGRNKKLNYGEKRDYTLAVEYWDGQNYQPITDSNREKLAEVGRKRIVITGHNTYEGQTGYQLFYIEPVDLSIPENRAKCKLEMDPSTYYYNGSEITPNFSFYYNNVLVGTKDDPQGNFTVSVENATNAGKDAKLSLNMTGTNFTGTYETTFEILPLPINSLAIDGTYTYNGREQTPVYKIKLAANDVDYTLVEGRDYRVVGYRAGNTGSFEEAKPVEAGTYGSRIEITTNNISSGSGYMDTRNFTIRKCNIADLPIAIDPAELTDSGQAGGNNEVAWNGGETRPGIIGVPSYMQTSDYEVTYENNSTVSATTGSALIHVKASAGSVNFTGQKDIRFTIVSRDLNEGEVQFEVTKTGTGTRPPYTLRLNVIDTGRTGSQVLSMGTDYDINEILYYDDVAGQWEKLQPSTDYTETIATNSVSSLMRAGKYQVTIEGKNDYRGTKIAADVTCGTDISAYVARITSRMSSGSQFSTPYDGTNQYPTDFELRTEDGNQQVPGITYSSDPANTDFTIAYFRNDTFWDMNKDAGTIYVIAVGEPTKGYFGRTTYYNRDGSYYVITPVKWDSTNFRITVRDENNIIYLPGGDTPKPELVLEFKTGAVSGGAAVWEVLEENRDYTTVYNSREPDSTLGNDLTSAGPKRVTITGTRNFEGNETFQNYRVQQRKISDPEIRVSTDNVNYGNLTSVQFEIDHLGTLLVEDVDYTKQQERDSVNGLNPIPNDTSAGERPGFHVFYTIKGKGNYMGERRERVDVDIVDLSVGRAVFADSAESAKPGQYYVIWNQDELLIENPMIPVTQRDPIKPENFTIMYKISETRAVSLPKASSGPHAPANPAYEIVVNGYGTNKAPGNNGDNFVTILGLEAGGYSGERQLQFTLYTNIEGATTTDTSLIKDGGVIAKPNWMETFEKAGEKGLLSLNQVSVDEGGTINPNEYTLDWDATFDPANPGIGSWTVRVIGSQAGAHCYYGTITIRFRVVNGIQDAVISVGGSNAIPYKGPDNPVTVTASGVNFRVTDSDGKELSPGRDYEILGYTGNDRIGEATVTIQGIGNYSGTVDHKFRVTYPINSLVVFMQEPDGGYVNRKNQNVTYSYTGSPIEPGIMLYCPLDFPANATDEDYLKGVPLGSELYALEYQNNIHSGTGTVVIKDCPYFTDASANAQRGVTFSIKEGSIEPPPEGTVSYTSTKYPNVEHIVAPYTGEHYTAADLGIELTDKGEKLQENVDYYIYYDGDMQNVSDPTNKPKITFSGVGNYEGSRHEIEFEIAAKSLKDTEITVDPVTMSYTDQASEQTIIRLMNVQLRTPTGSIRKLSLGTDFEIVNYFSDPQCNRPVTAANGIPGENGNYYIPTAQGTYYARINGIGNFTNTREITIEITKKDLSNDIKINFISSADSDCNIDNSGEPDCTYNGRAHEPSVNVTYGKNNTPLREGNDYTVSYVDNVNAGTAKVIVLMAASGNYEGEFSRTFTIKPKNIQQIEGGTVHYSALEESYRFDPDHIISIKPDITVTDSEMSQDRQDLKQEIDYTIQYNAESAELEKEDGKPECSYGGKVVVEITGIGNYTGTQKFVYYIGENIGDAYVQVNGSNRVSTTYNGLKQLFPQSSIQVKTNSNDIPLELPDGTKRYGYAYYKGDLETMVQEKDIVGAGTYYIAVTGNPRLGTYAKSTVSNSCVYTIEPRSIAQSYILVSGYDASYYYTGKEIRPAGIVVEDTQLPANPDNPNGSQYRSVKLVNGVDYDISYSNNTYAGKASIVVTGKGNYSGTRDAYFTIISSDTTGNNTGDSTSEGSGSLSNGTTTIYAKDIVLGFSNSQYNCMLYNGSPQTPIVSINGLNNNDFMVTARNNIAPGVATLEITGIGTNYTGTIYKNYLIKADLSQYGTILGIPDQVYTGYQITPTVTLTCGGNLLNQGSDFTVTYANNTNVGRATVMAHATGNSYYIGTATGGFNISNAASGMQVTGYASAYTYTGYAITPDVVVTMNGRVLNRGTDYTVSYANNINVGTASMTVTGLGSYSGSRTINFTIEAKNIENCLTTEVKDYQYNGSTYTPVITVTDSSTGKTLIAGTDYTITYSNNTNPGTAQITVTALSKNYTGTKVIPFQITSAAVSGLRTSTIKNNSIKLAWSKQEYADGYQICNSNNRVVATTRKNSYTVKGLTSCTTYKFKVRSYVENADGTTSYGNFSTAVSAKTLLNTPKLSAKASGSGKITLTWTKVAKATGYEIYYSTKKNGKYTRLKTVSKSSKRKYVDKGLAKGEKYYYTIRAYRTANGVKTYSNFNTIKSVKVK